MIGVVLAGGGSRRMGIDKATVELAGRPLIAWVVDALEAVCPRVVISGNDWEGRQRLDDHPDYEGPVAGLAAALELGDDVLLVGVDQPWVRVETLAALADRSGTAVPTADGAAQVTCARYLRTLDLGQSDGSLQSVAKNAGLVERETWSTWGEDGRSWFSVDRPEDLATGLERFGLPQPPM
ncbi:MAG: molybdenum cofactor guanylyltransferase [Acidimicrobiia bacterium]